MRRLDPDEAEASGSSGTPPVSGAGAAVGVLAGGLLAEYASWRWIFFSDLPVGVAVVPPHRP